jgi:uncharacterized repeat protein (TIGR01451 family)
VFVGSNASKGYYDYNSSTWTIGDLSVNEVVILEIFVQLNGTGLIDNIAEAGAAEYNIGENITDESSASFISIPKSVLVVNLSSNVTSYYNGETVTYTIVVTNYGPDIAHNLRVEDVLHSKLIYVLNSATVNPVFNKDTNSLLWIFDSLGVGESLTIEFNVVINGTGAIGNTVGVDCDENNLKGLDIYDTHPITKLYLIKQSFSIESSVHTTVLEVHTKKGKYGKSIILTATLKDESGNPATNKLVKIYVGGKFIGNAVTDSNGELRFKYTPKKPGKSYKYTILMVFEGDDYHAPVNATGTLEVEAENKTVKKVRMKHTGASFDGILIVFVCLISLFVLGLCCRRKMNSKGF